MRNGSANLPFNTSCAINGAPPTDTHGGRSDGAPHSARGGEMSWFMHHPIILLPFKTAVKPKTGH